jgi:spore coat polysaccharide biosynthesis protein SpsF
MKIVAIIQARMGSTRLPGKVLMDICGKPMLTRCYDRAKKAETIHEIVVATTNQEKDDVLEDFCRNNGWNSFRGSQEDVLDRYYFAAKEYDANAVVRITSDCPLIDHATIDSVVRSYLVKRDEIDYVSNLLPMRTYPRGLDTEIVSFDALERAWSEDTNPRTREHVTQYIVCNPSKFRLMGITNPIDFSYMRWTVDVPEDLELVRMIYSHFGELDFSWNEVVEFLLARPELLTLNNSVEQKAV